MTWWNIDTALWPGPNYEPDWITDDRGVRYPDTSNIAEIKLDGHDRDFSVGSLYIKDGIPLGVIMGVAYDVGPKSTTVFYQSTGSVNVSDS